MINLAICEDYTHQAEIILTLLDKYQTERPSIDMRAQRFTSGGELLEELNTGNVFDIFLLDILMPGINGIDLARKIREIDADVPLVFMTFSKDYALDAFRVSAVQYILKPVTENFLFPVLDKIIAALKREEERFFIVSTPNGIVKIPFASIVCVELARRVLRVYLENGNILHSKSIRMPFAESISPLLEDSRFLYAHKSFVLNMALVEKLGGNCFTMKNDFQVPVPRSKYAEAKAKYLAYLSGLGIGLSGGK